MKNCYIKNIEHNIIKKWSKKTNLSFHDNVFFSIKENNNSIYFRIRVDWESWLIKEKLGIKNEYDLNPDYSDILFIDIAIDKTNDDQNDYSNKCIEYVDRDIYNFIVDYRNKSYVCEFCFINDLDDENELDYSFLSINCTNIRWRLTNEVIIKKDECFNEEKVEHYLLKNYKDIKEF